MKIDPLDELRESIDCLNMEILEALSKRAEISERIGEEKKKRNLPVLDENREQEVIKRILAANRGPIGDDDLASLFGEIMRISRKLQK